MLFKYAPDPGNAGGGIGVMEFNMLYWPYLQQVLLKNSSKLKKLLIAVIAVFLLPVFAKAQFTISGSVSEKTNHASLAGANISIKNINSTSSSTRGEYQLKNIKAGKYVLTISFVGYETQHKTIQINGDQQIDFVMETSAYLAAKLLSWPQGQQRNRYTYKNRVNLILKLIISDNLPFILNIHQV